MTVSHIHSGVLAPRAHTTGAFGASSIRFSANATPADDFVSLPQQSEHTQPSPWKTLVRKAGQLGTWLLNTFLFNPVISLYQAWYTRPRIQHSFSKVGDWFSRNYYGNLNEKELKQFAPIRYKDEDHPVVGQSFRVDPINPKGPKIQTYWLPALKTVNNQLQEDQTARKTIVMGHGYRWDYQGMLATAQDLRQQGFNVMLFDFRNHGRSEDRKTTFGYDEAEDVATVIQSVKTHFADKSETLLYMGHSMGAAAIMLAGEKLGNDSNTMKTLNSHLDGIILDSPYQSLNRFITDHVITVTRSSPGYRFLKWLWPTALLERFEKRIVESLSNEDDWYPALGTVPNQLKTDELFAQSPLSQKPLLLIHGTKDAVTSFEHAEGILSTLHQGGRQAPLSLLALVDEDHTGYNWQPLANGKQYQTVNRYSDKAKAVIRHFIQSPSTRLDETEIYAPPTEHRASRLQKA